MTTRTINYHGFDFHLAEADGELLDIDLDSADEFMAHHGDDFAEGRLDEGYSAEAMEKWAEDHLLADVQALIDWPLWSESERRGVNSRDLMYPRS